MLLVKHRDYLKSDMVQMAHHGQNGVNKRFTKPSIPASACGPHPPGYITTTMAVVMIPAHGLQLK